MVLFDLILGGLFWPFVKKHWNHHIYRDKKDGLKEFDNGGFFSVYTGDVFTKDGRIVKPKPPTEIKTAAFELGDSEQHD